MSAAINCENKYMELIYPIETENQVLYNLDNSYEQFSEMLKEEREFLNSLLLRYQPTKILELGVCSGASSIIILNAIKNNSSAKLYSIDYNTNHYRIKGKQSGFYVDNYPELKDKWSLFTGAMAYKFIEQIGNGIDFVLIDTVHSNPGEILDLLMILPFIKDDAVIVFHDTNLHAFVRDEQWSKMQYTNNMLLSVLQGTKLIQGNFIKYNDNVQFPNIGAVKINSESKKRIFDIFNLLTHRWQYLLKENECDELAIYFKKYYGEHWANYFKDVIDYQKKQYNLQFANNNSCEIWKNFNTDKNTLNIVFSSDNNYVPHLAATMASILINSNKEEKFNFYILTSGINEDYKQKLTKLKKLKDFNIAFIAIDRNDFNMCPISDGCEHISINAYYRFLIPQLFKHLEKVLYLDCDVIVKKSLKSFFETDITNYYAAAVEDMAPCVEYCGVKEKLAVNKYFNSGVMLFNITKMNEDNIVDNLFQNTIKLQNENKITWVDQCVLNYTLKDKIKFISQKYNLQFSFLKDKDFVLKTISKQEYADIVKNPVIIHYSSPSKPWNCKYDLSVGKEYFKYLDKTDFGYSILEKIFSIKNINTHKIITILGIKIKLRRKK